MNENLFNVKIIVLNSIHIIHDNDCIYAPASTLYSQKMLSLGSRLIACCKLAPTLARQM